MRRISFITFILLVTILLSGCQTPPHEAEGVLLLPKEKYLSEEQIQLLEKKSKSGSCEASYRLFEYYGFFTSYHWLTLHYGELAIQQGCDEAIPEVEDLKYALGVIDEEP